MAFYSKTVKMKDLYSEIIANLKANGWTQQELAADSTPNMRDYSVPTPYNITQGANYSSYYGWKAFNGEPTEHWYGSNASNQWIRWDWGASDPRTIVGYSIMNNSGTPTQSPKDFRLEGSNDGTTYTTLDTRTNEINWVNGERRVYTFTNTTPYRYYRLYCVNNNGGTYITVTELELFEDFTTAKSRGQVNNLMTSVGTSGTDNIFIFCHEGSTKNPLGNHLSFLTGEGYNLSIPSQYLNLNWAHYYLSATYSASSNSSEVMLTYYMEVDADRFLLATVLDPSAANTANNVIYMGLMKRYMNETDNYAMTVAMGMLNQTAYPRVMRNKANAQWANYSPRVIQNNYSPSTWGDVVFVSPVFMEGDYEGMRGELKGVFTCRSESIVNEDEITVGTMKYKAIVITAWGSNSFPYAPILFRLPPTP